MLKRNASSTTHQGRNVSQVEQGISGRVALAVAVAMSAAAAAQAQTAARASDALEEITVTATRRAESIQDVPISLSAFSQEKMDMQGVKSVDDIARLTPGVSFQRGQFGGSDLTGTSVSIRGIGSGAGAAPIAVYVDDTPMQSGATTPSGNFNDDAFVNVFDLERVEVLRGPQGTLFGAGAEGGAIRFITHAPDMTKASVYAKTEVSQTQNGAPSYEAGIAGGAPIIEDKLGFRASVWTRRDGGYVDLVNYYTGQTTAPNNNWGETLAARFALGWKPTDTLTVTPSILYQKAKANGSSTIYLRNDNITDPKIPLFNQPYGNFADGQYVDLHQVPQKTDQRQTLSAIKVEWMLPHDMELISNTSYYEREENGVVDYTYLHAGNFAGVLFANPVWSAASFQEQINKYTTQEVRLLSTDTDSPLRWQTGVFYSHTKNQGNSQSYDPYLANFLNAGGLCFGGLATCVSDFFGSPLLDGQYTFRNLARVTETQKAAFANLDYKLPLHLIATVGVRYSRYTNDFWNALGGPTNGKPWPTYVTGNAAASTVTPKYVLSYKVEDFLVYASATKGFRDGGSVPPVSNVKCQPSLAILGLKDFPLSYKPDSLWSYELGSKWTGLNGKLTAAASVFDIVWKNQIRNVQLPTCAFAYTSNIGSTQSRGFDFDLQYRPIESLVLSANGGYQFVKVTETYKTNPTAEFNTYTNGDALPGSYPTVNLAAQYSFVVADHPSYARVDYYYQGQTARGANFNPLDSSYPQRADRLRGSPLDPAYANAMNFRDPSIKNTNVRLGSQFGEWDVSLFCNNLFNYQPLLNEQRAAITFSSLLTSELTAMTVRPRTFGVTAVYRY